MTWWDFLFVMLITVISGVLFWKGVAPRIHAYRYGMITYALALTIGVADVPARGVTSVLAMALLGIPAALATSWYAGWWNRFRAGTLHSDKKKEDQDRHGQS